VFKGNTINLRFKRVSNYSKFNSQEAFILEKSEQGLRGDQIIEALLENFKDDLNRMFADMSLNPPALAAFIEGVPASKSQAVVKALWSRLNDENKAALNRALILRPAVQQMTEGE
jgi:hypothetical protein